MIQPLIKLERVKKVFATDEVGQVHVNLSVETARAQQRAVEHIGTIRRRDDDDALGGVEAVHLHQQ